MECIQEHCRVDNFSSQGMSHVSIMIMLNGMLQLYLSTEYVYNIHIFMTIRSKFKFTGKNLGKLIAMKVLKLKLFGCTMICFYLFCDAWKHMKFQDISIARQNVSTTALYCLNKIILNSNAFSKQNK